MGTDKAWLELGGRAMIEHVIAAITPVTEKIAILAKSPEYERLGFPVFADSCSDVGPLEAIRSALSNITTPRAILVGCDLPWVTADLFKLLLSISEGSYATVPIGADGKLEPLCAIYRPEALPAVTDLINQGARKVRLLFDLVPTRFVAFEELRNLKGSEVFFENINTPADYARARDRLRASGETLR
jgi:molybdopterin-guanine dinucleotide biosynthesis protein A